MLAPELVCAEPNPEKSIPVRVYFNLHRHVWSIQDRRTGRVVAHVAKLTVRKARFVVRMAGWRKTVETGRKNVHSFVVGDWDTTSYVPDIDASTHERVRYNPKRGPQYTIDGGGFAESADEVVMFADRSVWAAGLSESV